MASMVLTGADERDILLGLDAFFRRQAPGHIVTWNGSAFDNPFLRARAQKLNLPDAFFKLTPNPQIVPKYDPLPGYEQVGYDLDMQAQPAHYYSVVSPPPQHTHIDVAYLWKEWAAKNSSGWGLKAVARAVGLQGVIEVDRQHMEKLSLPELMMYNLSDVIATYQLAVLLPTQNNLSAVKAEKSK